jgi:hypothetical protein
MKNNTEEEKKDSITVQLLNVNGDVKIYDDVKFIRVISLKYNLIIMRDYLPIIGEVEGEVEIVRATENINLEKVKGYFMHKHNKFNLFYVE